MAPLIVHIVHALGIGGMENGLVNLINRLPSDQFRHGIICLTEYTRFSERIEREGVRLYALGKRAGKDPAVYIRLWRLLRELRPQIVHTRNLATLECQIPAALAGVPGRIHGEHGRDMPDLYGANRRYRWLRRACRPFVDHFVALSLDLQRYLEDIGTESDAISRIRNGVDVERFHPAVHDGDRAQLPWSRETDVRVIGWVGRMESVKAPLTLARAFIRLMGSSTGHRPAVRIVMVGSGTLQSQVQEELREAGLGDVAWLPGDREDVPELMRSFDLFVLPSLAEGISNTVLEAVATGLPVVATRVGGNAELIKEGETGALVDAGDEAALAEAMGWYVDNDELLRLHGLAARELALREFSIERMVEAYGALYHRVMADKRIRALVGASGNGAL